MRIPRSWVWFYKICLTKWNLERFARPERRAGPAHCGAQALATAVLPKAGLSPGRLSKLSGVLPPALGLDSGQEFSAGEPQSSPGCDLGGNPADPGAVGKGERTGAGTQDPDRRDDRAQPYPSSPGFSAVVRCDPHGDGSLLEEVNPFHQVSYQDHCRAGQAPVDQSSQRARESPQEGLVPRSAESGQKDATLWRNGVGADLRVGGLRSLVIVEKLRHYLELLQKVREQTER